MKKNNVIYHLIFLTIFILSLSLFISYFSLLNQTLNYNDCEFVINKKDNALTIGKRLENKGIINSYFSFILVSKLMQAEKKLKPGSYDLKDIKNIKNLVERLTIANRDFIKIIIPEGWTIEQIAERISSKTSIDKDKFVKLCYDENIIKKFEFINSNSLEGYLFPETYFLSYNQNEFDIIVMMINQFKKMFNTFDFNETKFTLHEIITLASIIQGEGKVVEEMPMIASVFINRIRKNMSLDANATIQYIIPGKNRRLFNKDLEIKNPYNTYRNKGLPPGPINNPGISAIKAALMPSKTNYIYFVRGLDSIGKHVFSTNIKDHEIAKRKYLKSLGK
tara:strand:- start:774 stop:1778 length:1005 start_codon:yes stop_codon:yes gene_type:complete